MYCKKKYVNMRHY